DAASYFQSPASSLTPRTICSAVSPGPEGNSRRSSCPVARIFTCVPPTSTTSTFMVYPSGVCSPRQRPPEQMLAGLRQGRALGGDHRHEFVPGLHERLRALVLELGGQGVAVDAGPGELRQHRLAVAAVYRQQGANLAVVSEGFQGAFGHGVHRESSGEGLDVQDVGRLGVL